MNISRSPVLGSLAFLATASVSHAVLLADFDGGGVAYAEASLRDAPAAGNEAGVAPGGPTGSYYSLLKSAQGSSGNYLSFVAPSSTSNWTSARFTMDYSSANVAADGFSVGFLDVATHGASGAIKAGTTGLSDAEERGTYSNSIGVGFRTFNGTSATANYNGVESGDTAYDLVVDNIGSLEVLMTRDLATKDVLLNVNMYSEAGLGGTSSSVFADYAIANVTMEEFRVQVAGRTGGAAMDFNIDNLNLDVVNIPEPTSTALLGLASLGLLIRKRS